MMRLSDVIKRWDDSITEEKVTRSNSPLGEKVLYWKNSIYKMLSQNNKEHEIENFPWTEECDGFSCRSWKLYNEPFAFMNFPSVI